MWLGIGLGIGAFAGLVYLIRRRKRLKAEHVEGVVDIALNVVPEVDGEVVEKAVEVASEVAGHVVEAAASSLDS